MKWVVLDNNYLNYLRNNGDKHIPNNDYGTEHYKPFFGELFKIGDISYLTQVSSYKTRHNTVNNDLDFYKLITKENKIIAVVNLNYMFPAKNNNYKYISLKDIDKYRTFKSEKEKIQYQNLLKLEMKLINKGQIDKKAFKLYVFTQQNPNHIISKRCLDFKQLETVCVQYNNIQINKMLREQINEIQEREPNINQQENNSLSR